MADGPAYLRSLAEGHRRALALSFGVVPDLYQSVPSHEAMGFEMSDRLLGEFRNLSAERLGDLKARRVSLIAPAADRDALAVAARYEAGGTPVEAHDFRHRFDWASEEALNTALVPQEAVRLLAECIAPEAARP